MSEAMSERDLREMRRLANEAYSQPVAARYERTLAKYLLSAVDEVCRSHIEATELRRRVESLEGALEEIRWMAKGRSSLIGVLTQVEAMLGPAIEIVSSERRDKWRAALSQANAHAELETRSQEEEE